MTTLLAPEARDDTTSRAPRPRLFGAADLLGRRPEFHTFPAIGALLVAAAMESA